MKIVMIAPQFYPHIGGVEKHVLKISEDLTKVGYEISVLTVKYENTPNSDVFNNIAIYRIPDAKIYLKWFYIFKYMKLLKQADIVHCHDYSTFIFWYLPFRLIYLKKSVFITFHGFEGLIPIPRHIIFLRKISEKLTKGNICIGDFIPKWYGTNPTMVLYGGVDLPKCTSDIKYSITDGLKVIFIGRLEEDTGIKEYLSALVILKSKYNLDISGYICGNGSLRECIKKELNIHGIRIEMLGFVSSPEVYLQKCQFAFVSGYLGILEAMAYKKLVLNIYTNELKKDYLRLMPNASNMMITVDSPEELAEKMVYYFNHPSEMEQLMTNAYKFAAEHSWGSVTDSYVKLWQR